MKKNNIHNALYIRKTNLKKFSFEFSINTLSQKPRAISFPRKRCNYQNHNRKEIVPFFLYLATKETFPSCPNATLPRKKYFFIIKSPPSQKCAQCWDRAQIVRVSAEDASTEPQEQMNLAIKTKRAIKILP